MDESHIPKDVLDYHDWVSDTINDYEEYIHIEAWAIMKSMKMF